LRITAWGAVYGTGERKALREKAGLFLGEERCEECIMITRTVNVKLPKNLSASPVALLVQKASKFDSIIYIEAGERKVNAKSIMGMMSIALDEGDELMIRCDGTDEGDALDSVGSFLTGAEA